MTIEGWSHIAISVPNTDAAVEWYGRVLGFPVAHSDSIASPDGHTFKITWMQGPDFSLELFEVPGSAPLPRERLDPDTDIKTLGNKFLSLGVEDIEKAREKLKNMGVEMLPSSTKGISGLFTRDNTGNLIELCERHA
ncbi:MAG: hypothetical protein A2Z02_01715 [Chloroflexi bacterium RBG_16_48_7]|nr:MAG: hypothetical protein A2Z02_01715 [Chloroflexi bacterium RBG_16_48_7]